MPTFHQLETNITRLIKDLTTMNNAISTFYGDLGSFYGFYIWINEVNPLHIALPLSIVSRILFNIIVLI